MALSRTSRKRRLVRCGVLGLGIASLFAASGCDDEKPQSPTEASEPGADNQGSPPLATPSRQPSLPDPEIKAAIERELLLDGSVNSGTVSIEVTDGVVELEGSLPHLLAKQRARLLASAVKGVRSISNQIVVDPVERPDSELEFDVEAALLGDPVSESFEIDVSVEDQVVTLDGTVQSWAERDLAERLALGVRGTREVDNNISIDYGADRSDSEIERDIESKLRWDALVDAAMIDVEVEDNRVALDGVVGSAAEKLRAEQDARYVLGATSVDSEGLEVQWWLNKQDLRKQKYPIQSDTEIVRALNDALILDPRVSAYEIVVAVRNGIATLTGNVGTAHAKRVASQIAQNTTGVSSVHNQLEIEPESPLDDLKLTDRVQSALERNPIVEPFEIAVSTDASIVNLAGTVDSFSEMAEAEDVAARVPGVLGVVNDLEVRTPAPITHGPYVYPYSPYLEYESRWEVYAPDSALQSDPEIREDIRDELFWSPFVDSDNIIVSVEAGEATLHGTVSDWRESAAARENAFEGGAISVDNQLVILN